MYVTLCPVSVCLLYLVFNVMIVVSRSEYLGCFVDEPNRKMKGDFKEFPDSLTPQVCMDFCKDKGYPYAGLQYSVQCFCGDQRPSASDKKPESDCSQKCSGDKSKNCGNDWRNSVYESGFTNALISDSRYDYLGCYIDQAERALSGYFQEFDTNNSPEICVDLCGVKGFAYAGLQYRTQCFCGDQDPKPEKKVEEQECRAKCSGDKRFNCGTDWRNNVYKTRNPGARSAYVGCFADQESRSLNGEFKDFQNTLTPQECMDFCKNKGYKFAGLQYSSQCFCGDKTPNVLDAKPESDCNMPCSRDKSQMCGGDWRNSVYLSGFTDALIFDSRYKYIGCYADQENREINGHFQELGDNNSPKRCIALCKDKGFVYAGLQYRTQCFCGNEIPKPEKRVAQEECKTKCPGDKRFNCGSDWRNNVYKTDQSGQSDPNYLGCYFDEHPNRKLISDFKDFGDSLTPQACIDYCKDKGYSYAGLQYSTQCYCGDHRPSIDDSRSESDCNTKCSGDESQICGGDWRNSVYKTGYTAAMITDRRYEYVGCFVDQEPRSLGAFVSDLGEENSPEKCITLCKQKGYVYAGLQARGQCFCGDEHPMPGKRADQKDCKYKCTGDIRFNCGGTWRNSVYKTGNPDSLVSDSRYQYLGCYIDQDRRELQGAFRDFGNENSPEKCVNFCKEMGYLYAGLQYTGQCFCGDRDPKPDKKTDPKDCKFKCPGDNRYNCGSDWRNNVYRSGHPGSTVAIADFEYMGCYIDQPEPRLLGGEVIEYPETLTPSLCVGVCQKKGYVYAGLQHSSQCFCGDNEVSERYKSSEADCHMKCTGDRTTICGGVWRNTLYRTGNKAPSVAKLPNNEYVGCYIDHHDRLLKGHVQDFPDTLTPELCVALCKRKGYIYAGLQASAQCFCGDEELPITAMVNDSDCSSKCTGDRSVFCGGIWRNTIYKTGNSGSSVANIGYLYMGCYRDISFPRKLKGFVADYPETLTPQHCVTVCKQKEFQFAGLQVGVQCFCGNEYPSDDDKRPESECNSKCAGELTAICGSHWRNTIYSTASSNDNDNQVVNMCATSVTRVNGKAACQNEVVFEDNFSSLSHDKWSNVVQIPNEPDYQFVIFKSDPANMYTASGKLVIKPTLLPENEVRNGDLHLTNCSGKSEKNECGYKARSYVILPPVQSARLTTHTSFSFQYGKVEISAKLPVGDWLVPEIWLEPKNNAYGPGYASGRISIAMSRGNNDLKSGGHDIGSKQLESGVLVGIGDNIRGRTILRETSDGWHANYHNYSVIWTPENIIFTIDGDQSHSMVSNDGQSLSDILGFSPAVTPIWSSASKIAPFDNEFYVSLGVSVGGVRNFPDNIINNGRPKPWKNLELKAMLNFWKDRGSWQQTWHDDAALLQVDYIKVTAL